MSVPVDFSQGAALVMAHPDDEVLWASSVLADLDRIVLCYERVLSFPAWGAGRKRSLEAFPLPNAINLGLTESEVFGSAAWPRPAETPYGLAVRRGPRSMAHFSEARYRENFRALTDALRPLLADKVHVITHNPWGEYGHEEHVQVFRAVAALRAELGFTLWVSGYVSDKSYALMLRCLPRLDCGLPQYPTDPALGEQLKELYRANDCWTWFDDYAWPARENFFRVLGPGEPAVPQREGSVMTMIWTKWRPRPPLPQRILRKGARTLRLNAR